MPQAHASLRIHRQVMSLAGLFFFAVAALPVCTAQNPAQNAADDPIFQQRFAKARDLYFREIAGDRSVAAAAHQALAALEEQSPNDPKVRAYSGSMEMYEAAHSWSVWNLRKEAAEGLKKLDDAVAAAPDDPEVRFIRAATSWHLPAFYHRQAQAEEDFEFVAARAEQSAAKGDLLPGIAAAALNYWGQILAARKRDAEARQAFAAAIRIAPTSPGATDARRRLQSGE